MAKMTELPHYCKHDMQFYEGTIEGLMQLADLEKCCIERLRVLEIVWHISLKTINSDPAVYREELVVQLRKKKLDNFADLCDGKGCSVNTEERLNWRIEALNDEGLFALRAINDINYPVLSVEEKERLKDRLSPLMEDPSLFESTTFYVVPCFDVLELLKTRIVHLERGQAFITAPQFRNLIYNHYRQRLTARLEKISGIYYHMEHDPRLENLRKMLWQIYKRLIKTIRLNSEIITTDRLDRLAVTSYPPCMRRIHEALIDKRHLRNGGRFQYTIFLKEIGVPGADAVEFYKKIFTEKMAEKVFEKEYGYRFRYMYGLAGSGKNYKVPNCSSIAQNFGSHADDCHGCFFVTEDIEDLGKNLDRWNIPSNRREEMVNLTKMRQPGAACAKYFNAMHECPTTSKIVNPLDYWTLSRKNYDQHIAEDPFFDVDEDM